MERVLTTALLASLMFGAMPTSAQRRTPPVPVARARAMFIELESAWRELGELDVLPGDANHALARWDHAWSGRLSRLERATLQSCEELTPASDCAAHERTALLCNLAADVRARRESLVELAEEGAVVGTSAPDPLEARVAIADEAARRSAEQISCANLPSPLEVEGSRATGWRFRGGRPLTTPPDPSAPVDGLSREQVLRMVTLRRASLDACWHAEIANAPSDVRLRVAVGIATSGEVTDVAVTGADTSALTECVERAVRAWHFDASAAESHTAFNLRFTLDL